MASDCFQYFAGNVGRGVVVVEAEVPQGLKPDSNGRLSAQLKLCPDTKRFIARRKGLLRKPEPQVPPLRFAPVGMTRNGGLWTRA